MRPQGFREWVVVVVTALGVMVAVLLPVYVVRAVNNDTERVLMQLDENRNQATERSIRVNVSTISCMLLIEPSDRNNANLAECVRDGLEEFERLTEQATTTTTPKEE